MRCGAVYNVNEVGRCQLALCVKKESEPDCERKKTQLKLVRP